MARRWLLPVACLIWSLLAPDVYAQKLHALVVGDESPWAHWGEFLPNIQIDMTQIWIALTNNVPDRQLNMLTVTIESPEDGHPDRILAALDELRPASDDTLLFYFTGHGGLDDQGSYLALEQGKLYRDTILGRMTRKGARLSVLLTDCCNARGDGKISLYAAPAPEEPEKVTPAFRTLFFEPEGTVDVNACSPGETAQFFVLGDGESFRDKYRGSLFTRSLTDYLERRRSDRLSWDELLREVSVTVHVEFGRNYPGGVPMAKGTGRQTGQNVYAASYPGRPDNRGPRAGLIVRDTDGRGALIVRVDPGSPSTKVFDLQARRYTTLQPQQVIRTANGRAVQGATDFIEITKGSPQVMRIEAGTSRRGWREYLIRLKY